MKLVCNWCKAELDNERGSDFFITDGICSSCCGKFLQHADSLKELIDRFEAPILIMQSDPRQALTANQKACGLFKKELSQIEGYRGGQILDCSYACTEGGCGLDINCVNCEIKNAVVETFTTGKSLEGVSTTLQIKKDGDVNPYTLKISTEKFGEFALVRIDQYEKKATCCCNRQSQ
jgi:hypothetical protein